MAEEGVANRTAGGTDPDTQPLEGCGVTVEQYESDPDTEHYCPEVKRLAGNIHEEVPEA